MVCGLLGHCEWGWGQCSRRDDRSNGTTTVCPAEGHSGQLEGQSKLTAHHPSSPPLQAGSLDGSFDIHTPPVPQGRIKSVSLASIQKERC